MKNYIILAFLFVTQLAVAQNTTARLSLSDAIGIAVKNRKEIAIQQINTEVSANEIRKINGKHLPQITSDVDVRYNSQLQTNILPGAVFGSAEDKKVKFGTKYNTFWAFNLNMPLYNPADAGDRKIAQTQLEYDRLNATRSEIDVRQQVTESYFAALLWKEKLMLSETNFKRTQSLYEVAQDQLRQGSILAYDVQHNRIDYENAMAENRKNDNSYRLALADLVYKMGIDSVTDISLSDDLMQLFDAFQVSLPDEISPQRVELRQEKIKGEIHQMNIRKQKLSYIPTVSIYGNYTFQYLNNSFEPFSSSTWYPYNYLGLKASIPVFDGFQKKRARQGYELQFRATELNLEKLDNDYRQEARNASTAMQNAQSDYENQKRNLELANQLYTIDSDRLKNGTIKQNDLATSYYTLQQTQTNYVNAIYSYLVAVIQYKKALGLL